MALRHGSHNVTCKLHHACLAFVSVRQMAPPLNVVANIYCSSLLIYRPREDERLSWPGWLTYSGRFTHIIASQLHVDRRTAKERWPETDVLPLSHAGQPETVADERNARLELMLFCCRIPLWRDFDWELRLVLYALHQKSSFSFRFSSRSVPAVCRRHDKIMFSADHCYINLLFRMYFDATKVYDNLTFIIIGWYTPFHGMKYSSAKQSSATCQNAEKP